MFRKTESKWIQSVNADIRAGAANERFVRIADLGAYRSEGPLTALSVDIYMVQHSGDSIRPSLSRSLLS